MPGLEAFAGHSAHGSWALEVHDDAVHATGKIKSFGLELAFA